MRAETVKGSQQLPPLFEFSGACAGCGETPYLKLLTQLVGDRMLVANATGCSSIYGGNLPTTPWSVGADGRGPAWSNSLFEDNAEFGLGMRLGLDAQRLLALELLETLEDDLGESCVRGLVEASESRDGDAIARQRLRVDELRARLQHVHRAEARDLEAIADALTPTSVWIVGGDGWAYDIGFGGLDHVLASGRNVNVLVLDTEVYSNTGGQASKSTPRGAVAKFAAAGKGQGKKDLGMIATAYGDVYVGQIAMGADMPQTVKVLAEAEAHRGPSLVIAYSHCIAHGIDMSTAMTHQRDAVATGYWPLWRYEPEAVARGRAPVPSRFEAPVDPPVGVRVEGSTVRDARPLRSGSSRGAATARRRTTSTPGWRLYEQLAEVDRGPDEPTGPTTIDDRNEVEDP